jgi:hypothetical protein
MRVGPLQADIGRAGELNKSPVNDAAVGAPRVKPMS